MLEDDQLPTFLQKLQVIVRSGGAEAVRFQLLRRLVRLAMPQYRLKWYNLDWWHDADFNAYLSRFGEADGLNIDRRWIVHQLLRLVADIGGDTAECGVFQGATSFLICKANEQTKFERTHFMFDSFEGLSEPNPQDGVSWHKGDLATTEDLARQRLQGCKNTAFMKGWIPTRFCEVADRRFAFVHIDVDLYEPTRDSIEFFYPRLNEGAILVVDDFGFSSCPGATRAVEQLTENLAEKMIALPDGGGFLIKGRAVAPVANLIKTSC